MRIIELTNCETRLISDLLDEARATLKSKARGTPQRCQLEEEIRAIERLLNRLNLCEAAFEDQDATPTLSGVGSGASDD